MEKIKSKFLVIKYEDIAKLDEDSLTNLKAALYDLNKLRESDEKKENEYLVVNRDEPYAWLVEKMILGEVTAYEIVETLARNCVAWSTSKDKKEGLLPEVAYFKNPALYKKLTGEDYIKNRAIKKFNIGES